VISQKGTNKIFIDEIYDPCTSITNDL